MIKNQPLNLDSSHINYAESFIGNTKRENDANQAFTCNIEFVEWTDNPQNWCGAWGGTHVLAVISDYSITKLKSLQEQEAAYVSRAKYDKYCIPYMFQKTIDDTCYFGDQLCSRGSISYQEYLQLWSDMGMIDRENWLIAQKKYLENAMKEINAYPTIEQAVKIYLAGNDDCTYSLCVGTRKEAMEILEGLKNCPTWEMLCDYGFVFTN